LNISPARRSLGARASKSITGFNHRPTFRGCFIKTIRPIPTRAILPCSLSLFSSLSIHPSGIARKHGPRRDFVSFHRSPTSFVSIDFLAAARIIIAKQLDENETVARNNGRRKRVTVSGQATRG
jgi:hypothetical protein